MRCHGQRYLPCRTDENRCVAASALAIPCKVVAMGLGTVGLGVTPLRGGRAVALRAEPLSKAQRLDPDGLPSLTQYGQAGDAG